jgi:hypothetical protein
LVSFADVFAVKALLSCSYKRFSRKICMTNFDSLAEAIFGEEKALW